MFQVIKKSGKIITAYRLGDSNEALSRLIAEGKIIPREDGTYEIISDEVLKGGSGKGEIVRAGDYIKFSSITGYPYPNTKEYFLSNHKKISENEYEQIPKTLFAWDISEPMCEEIEFLIEKKGLKIDYENAERCFSAFLYGTEEAAARDAVIIFYSITKDADGHMIDADFNFIIREEFEIFYDYC